MLLSLLFVGPAAHLALCPMHQANLIEREKVTVTAGVPTIWMGVIGELAGRCGMLAQPSLCPTVFCATCSRALVVCRLQRPVAPSHAPRRRIRRAFVAV